MERNSFIGTLFTIGIHKTYYINSASIKNIIQNNHLCRQLTFSSTIQQFYNIFFYNSKKNSFRQVKCLSFSTGGFWQWVLIQVHEADCTEIAQKPITNNCAHQVSKVVYNNSAETGLQLAQPSLSLCKLLPLQTCKIGASPLPASTELFQNIVIWS